MPCVNIDIVAGRTPEQKKAAADVITQALVDYCGAHAEHVYVIFHDIAGSQSMKNKHSSRLPERADVPAHESREGHR